MSWWYYLLGALAIVIGVIAFVVYRGYNRIKPKPIPGIPCPPFTHAVLGHPDAIMHPFKHEFRLELCNATDSIPAYQLVFMKHASVFVNDPKEVGNVFNLIDNKGALYKSFRYDNSIPDFISSDGQEFLRRKNIILPALNQLKIPTNNKIIENLLDIMNEKSESNEPIDLKELFAQFSLDIIIEILFKYSLNSLKQSQEGKVVLKSLFTLAEAQNNTGIYILPNARKISHEELTEAKSCYRIFLEKLTNVIKSSVDTNQSNPLINAIIEVSTTEGSGDKGIMNEIHQLIKHSYETISGTLLWIFFVLFKYPQIRAELELDISQNEKSVNLENIIKETLRRYPVAGNMTVRTVGSEGYAISNVAIPPETPVHLHIWSLHNSKRNWEKPLEFIPDRWLEDSTFNTPRCPFMASSKSSPYDGVGVSNHSVSYCPFSTGDRICKGKDLALDIIRAVVRAVASQYHLNPAELHMDEEVGLSISSVILPYHKKSVILKVSRIISLGKYEKKETVKTDDGWADEDDE